MNALFFPFAFAFVRFSAFFVTLGVLQGALRPVQVVILNLALAVALARSAGLTNVNPDGFPFFVCAELWLGFLLALPTSLIFHVLSPIGKCADLLRGMQMAELFIPGHSSRVSPLEGLVLFVMPGIVFCPELFERLLGPVFDIPLVATLVQERTVISVLAQSDVILTVLTLSGAALKGSILVLTPLLVAVLVMDSAIALLSRLTHPLNLTFELIPVKLLIGLLAVSAFSFSGQKAVTALFASGLEVEQRMVAAIK